MEDYNEVEEKQELERARDELEFIMSSLPDNLQENRIYLSGLLDGWEQVGVISEENRGILYMEYGVG